MTLAIVGTLSTNKPSNKQKETKNTQFQHDVLQDNKYGNGFWVNFIELEAQKTGSIDQKKRNTSLSYQKTPNRSNKDKKLISARNSHITSALNLISYEYICISST